MSGLALIPNPLVLKHHTKKRYGVNAILTAENWGIAATSYPDNTLAGYFIPD